MLSEIHFIVVSMQGIFGPKRDVIIKRQLSYFFKANEELRAGVADGLGIKISKKELEPAG